MQQTNSNPHTELRYRIDSDYIDKYLVDLQLENNVLLNIKRVQANLNMAEYEQKIIQLKRYSNCTSIDENAKTLNLQVDDINNIHIMDLRVELREYFTNAQIGHWTPSRSLGKNSSESFVLCDIKFEKNNIRSENIKSKLTESFFHTLSKQYIQSLRRKEFVKKM